MKKCIQYLPGKSFFQEIRLFKLVNQAVIKTFPFLNGLQGDGIQLLAYGIFRHHTPVQAFQSFFARI